MSTSAILISFSILMFFVTIYIYLEEVIDLSGTVVVLENVRGYPKKAIFVVTGLKRYRGTRYLRCYSDEHGEIYLIKDGRMTTDTIYLNNVDIKYADSLKGYYVCCCAGCICRPCYMCNTLWD